MNSKKYKWILYFISITILVSIVALLYFNYRNYLLNKANYIYNIQQSLDVATDDYFSERAKREKANFKAFFSKFDEQNTVKSIKVSSKTDSTSISISVNKTDSVPVQYSSTKIAFFPSKTDSLLKSKELETILISITDAPIQLKKLDSFFKAELKRKNIETAYQIRHYNKDVFNKTIVLQDSILHKKLGKNYFTTNSKSTFLDSGERIELRFKNNALSILKDGIIGILLSLFLSIAIISSLFYLLHIIKKQKQIAEIKNDFINNITHEFKTPITTIHTAIEAIKNFNLQGNFAKTNEYLDISKDQLNKLNLMVEKILETSALDSEKLLLKKQETDIVFILKELFNQAKTNSDKEISFQSDTDQLSLNLDVFHFKNAIYNLIENAIKYGGDKIEITLKTKEDKIQILIKDSGVIPDLHRKKIFEKFYRIPTGNKHDVKGFGIGLYYAKNIIEKHNGTLKLAKDKQTIFIIELLKDAE